MLELLVGVVVIGVMSAIAIPTINYIGESTQNSKLYSDVGTVNSSIRIYLANGGSLENLETEQAILDKLKTSRSEEDAEAYAGIDGAMIDKRIIAVMQTDEEIASTDQRAVWNAAKKSFQIQTTAGVKGVARFSINEGLATVDYGEEDREGAALDYNIDDGWIWSYHDTSATPSPIPTLVPVSGGSAEGAGTSTSGTGTTTGTSESDGSDSGDDGSSGATRLSTPHFAPGSGTFPAHTFPKSINIANPNPNGASQLYWATEWNETSITWNLYTGNLSVADGQQVLAYAKSLSPNYLDSFTTGASYAGSPEELSDPIITASPNILDLASNVDAEITIVDTNITGSELKYLLPDGEWLVYSEPISITPSSYGSGFTVLAKAFPTESFYLESDTATKTLDVKLLPPTVGFDAPYLDLSANSAVEVTLADANPSGGSYSLEYKLPGAAWETYGSAVDVIPSDYASGLTIETRAVATGNGFIDSDTGDGTATIKLAPPVITLSSSEFTDTITSITATLSDAFSGLSTIKWYKITNMDTGVETAWTSYASPLTLLASDYPEGFTVSSYASSNQSNYLQSGESTAFGGSFFGIGIDAKTIFLIDNSGSMRWGGRIDDVKSEMVQSLAAYPENGSFAIITFNSNAQVLSTWALATPAEVASAQAAVNAISATGHTNYVEAIDMALDVMNENPGDVGQVIFLSDGKPQAAGNSTPAILAKIDEVVAGGAVFDTIGFKLNHVGQALLESMAAQGNGSHSEID